MFRLWRKEARQSHHPDVPAGETEIRRAYRLILGREVDAAGLAAYLARTGAGQLGLRTLIEELLSSEEFCDRPSRVATQRVATLTPPPGPEPAARTDLIRPADVISRLSAADLNATAEAYYKRIPDPTPLQAKPFAFWHETPQILHDLGLLLDGLRVGKGMAVLDFGAGTCWLTRILSQLGCDVVATDVSASALDIGRDLFRRHPPLGNDWSVPEFLLFDGTTLALPPESIDRVICFDAFHHVPNPTAVLRELFRVLRPGGIVGMSEPGRLHSASPQSQYEMKNHDVLENDIDLSVLGPAALEAGFTDVSVVAFGSSRVSLEDYAQLTGDADSLSTVAERIWQGLVATTSERTIFYLAKGEPVKDSRRHEGLAHQIKVEPQSLQVSAGEPLVLSCLIDNIGEAAWIHQARGLVGTVRIGCHLFAPDMSLLNLDFSRHEIPRTVRPGSRLEHAIDLPALGAGRYVIAVDLVAEGVTWFENVGSKPALVSVVVH